jgi:integrase/recombinase XerD
LDRNEVGSLLVSAGLGAPHEHALISLLAINGLRIFEALGADIDKLGLERGHRTLTVLRKGGKIRSHRAQLAPSTSRSVSGSTGRSSYARTGNGWIGTAPAESCVGSRAAPAWTSRSAHTPLRHAFITAALDAGVPLRDVQEAASHADPRTTMRYDRARVSLDRHATYIVAAYLAGAAGSCEIAGPAPDCGAARRSG